MNCCGNSHKSNHENNQSPQKESENKPSGVKNIFVWGVVIVLTISLIAWLI